MSRKEFKIQLQEYPELFEFIILEANKRDRSYKAILVGCIEFAKLNSEKKSTKKISKKNQQKKSINTNSNERKK